MEVTLTTEETRVLGALIEKDLSTPEYYPMTLSALVTACNQKTNRHPVVAYEESDVAAAIESLQRKRLVGSSTSAHGRAIRYRHAMVEALRLARPQLAVLASLMLRGPETPGELRGRANRMYPFESLEEVDEVLSGLMRNDPPYVARLERRPGQKEARYAQLFSDVPVDSDEALSAEPSGEALAERVSSLEQQMEELRAAFAAFRSQFE